MLDICAPTALYNLPANIGQLSKLNTFKIMYAYFKTLPPSFGQLSSLERLELYTAASASQVLIVALAPLKQLTQLKYMELNGGLVSKPDFPVWLGSCHFPVLEDLRLGGGVLSLPSSISNFSNLTALIIERSRISEIPESIGFLHSLKNIHLGYENEAVSLPTSFSKLTSLEELGVTTDMQSFALVEHFTMLTELEFIQKMEEEVIMPYPEFLWTFTSLQTLKLYDSAVPSLPDALGNLKKLECLHLQSHQNLEEIPETLGNLLCLTQIMITDCPMLLELPESIGNLKILRELQIISCNGLRTLPESIGDLQRLETLNLAFVHSFERLPLSIGNLRALEVLTVDFAGEVFLPESFADLVLDKTADECSLDLVTFEGVTNILIGPRASLAFTILEERGVLIC